MLTITESSKGKRVWCCKESEGVTAEFKDGLQGHLYWSDFRRAVKVRSANGKPAPVVVTDKEVKISPAIKSGEKLVTGALVGGYRPQVR